MHRLEHIVDKLLKFFVQDEKQKVANIASFYNCHRLITWRQTNSSTTVYFTTWLTSVGTHHVTVSLGTSDEVEQLMTSVLVVITRIPFVSSAFVRTMSAVTESHQPLTFYRSPHTTHRHGSTVHYTRHRLPNADFELLGESKNTGMARLQYGAVVLETPTIPIDSQWCAILRRRFDVIPILWTCGNYEPTPLIYNNY